MRDTRRGHGCTIPCTEAGASPSPSLRSTRRCRMARSALRSRFIPGFLLAVGLACAPRAGAAPFFKVPFVSFDTGDTPYSVVVADFNADGGPDVATADFASNRVSVLLGNGNGTLGPASEFATQRG